MYLSCPYFQNRLRDLLFYYNNLKNDEKEQFLIELATNHTVDHRSVVSLSKHLVSNLSTSRCVFASYALKKWFTNITIEVESQTVLTLQMALEVPLLAVVQFKTTSSTVIICFLCTFKINTIDDQCVLFER